MQQMKNPHLRVRGETECLEQGLRPQREKDQKVQNEKGPKAVIEIDLRVGTTKDQLVDPRANAELSQKREVALIITLEIDRQQNREPDH